MKHQKNPGSFFLFFLFLVIGQSHHAGAQSPLDYLDMIREKSPHLKILADAGLPIHATQFPFPSNCWNNAMFFAGVAGVPYVSSSFEIDAALSSPLCRILKKEEVKRPGDLMAIRQILPYYPNPETGGFDRHIMIDAHSAIYLDEKMVYSQNGVSHDILIQPTQEVMDIYVPVDDRKEECLNTDNYDLLRGKCYTVISYHRCLPFRSFLEGKEGQNLLPLIRALAEEAISLDEKELKAMVEGDNSAIIAINQSRKDLAEKLERYLHDEDLPANDKGIVHLLHYKWQSLMDQRL